MAKLILVCGRTCAGKTEGGQILAHKFGYHHIEASSLMREFWAESGRGESLDIFARWSLITAPARVPATAIARGNGTHLVLTGLRSPAEVAEARKACIDSRLIFVHASAAARFDRAQRRSRPGHPHFMAELTAMDAFHEEMGLGDVEADPSVIRIENDGSLEDYANVLVRAAGHQPIR